LHPIYASIRILLNQGWR